MIRQGILLKHFCSFTGLCSDTNVGVRDELKVIPDDQMTNSTNNGSDFLPEFGRLHGTKAWCPDPADANPYLQIDLGQNYTVCAVEVQGEPGASIVTNFTLSTSTDDESPAFTVYNSNQVISYGRISLFASSFSATLIPVTQFGFIIIQKFLFWITLTQLETLRLRRTFLLFFPPKGVQHYII